MMRASFCLFLLCACSTPTSRAPAAAPTATVSTSVMAQSPCDLQAEPATPPVLPDALLAVAPQYFHAPHDGGFDAYTGGDAFPWFDTHDLQRPVMPPSNARVAASSARSLFVVDRDGELGVMQRGGANAIWTGTKFYPVQVVDSDDGHWALGRTDGGYRVGHFSDGRFVLEDLVMPANFHDRRIAVTKEGRLAVAWLDREAGELRVHLRIGADDFVADQVTLPEPVAELCQRTHVALAMAPQGSHGVAIAWRPLTDPDYDQLPPNTMLPQTPSAAEVRWFTFDPRSPDHRSVATHATVARPLGFATGVGPWPLSGNGLKATRLDGHAVFFWHDQDGIRAAVADQTTSTVIPSDGAALLAFHKRGGSDEMLALDSSPRVRAWRLSCQ